MSKGKTIEEMALGMARYAKDRKDMSDWDGSWYEMARSVYEAAKVDALHQNIDSMQQTKDAMSSKLQELQALVRELEEAAYLTINLLKDTIPVMRATDAEWRYRDAHADNLQVALQNMRCAYDKIPTELRGE